MKIKKQIVFGLRMVLGLLCFEVVSPKPNTTIKNRKKEIKKKANHYNWKGKRKKSSLPTVGLQADGSSRLYSLFKYLPRRGKRGITEKEKTKEKLKIYIYIYVDTHKVVSHWNGVGLLKIICYNFLFL